MPTNAWIPAALISFFLPGLGLLMLPKPELKSKGIKIFIGYIIVVVLINVVMGILLGILISATGVGALGYLMHPLRLVTFVLWLANIIYTHDATVTINPALGKPIFFKKILQ